LTTTRDSNQIKIRRIKANEFRQVFELIRSSFKNENAITGLDAQRLQRNARLYSAISCLLPIIDFLHIDFETLLVAVNGQRVVGQIHMVPMGRNLWSLDSAAVDAEYRGRGVYRNLMDEALSYIVKRRGKRIVTSLWTSNVAPVKVTGRLGYEVFEEEDRLILEIRNAVCESSQSDTYTIRTLSSRDIEQVYEVLKAVYPDRIRTLQMTPDDLAQSKLSFLKDKITGKHSKSWVLEVDGRVRGYVLITFTSSLEAANTEYLCTLPSKDSLEQAKALICHVTQFLRNQGISRIILNLPVEWKSIKETAESLGFRVFARVYYMKKELA